MSWSNPLSSLAILVRDRIEQWQSGGQPDTAQVLAEHPELREARSLVMDLALAEYSLRKENGDRVTSSEFCDQFPEYRHSLIALLEVQDFLDCCPGFAASDDSPTWPISGDHFLGYEIVEPLGRGGLARVFLARETAVGERYVVIKVSPLSDHEAHTLGKLSHPGIVPIHSVRHDQDRGWTVICMPLVGAATGIDLLDAAFNRQRPGRDAQLVARVAQETKPLTPVPLPSPENPLFPWYFSYSDALAQLALDIAQALEQAHSAGVLHRDLKPSNILLSWSGRAMLLDFNLSTSSELKRQQIGGTLAYMAPEIIESLLWDQGQTARRFDPRCDIYSLGVVLFELLTGRLPFRPAAAESLSLTAYQPWLESKRQPLAAAAAFPAEVDPQLGAIVSRCLQFEAADRFQNASELVASLRSYLSGPALAKRFAHRKRRQLLFAVLALAASVGGIFAYIASRPSELDSLYQQGLAQYDAGEFAAATATFTRCLELRAHWPPALFGRGQSLRRQEQWQAARADFVPLAKIEPAWAYALAGYCSMRANDDQTAASDFRAAYKANLRDTGFLLNFANVHWRRERKFEVESLYTEVLAVNPDNKIALRERQRVYIALVINDAKKQINPIALGDAKRLCSIEDSPDALYLASRVYAVAARHDGQYQATSLQLLKDAISRGFPVYRVAKPPVELRSIALKLDPQFLKAAPNQGTTSPPMPSRTSDPPLVANWGVFLRAVNVGPAAFAGSE